MTSSIPKNIITIATGKKLYLDLALNLYLSFKWWHKETEINFYIVTDQPEEILKYKYKDLNVISIQKGELGNGFSPKLHLDKVAPYGHTLFIDSDCLIFDNLGEVFERFEGNSVSVIGNYISEGEWFGDVKSICTNFGIAKLPKFNGGVYYLEKGSNASRVYEKARELEEAYDEIGFVRLRNRPNDEVLMALSMELSGMKPIVDDGSILSDPLCCQGKYKLDVLRGFRVLTNPRPPSPLNQKWYPFHIVSPKIVHFLGYYTQHHPYKAQVYKLRATEKGFNKFLIDISARLFISYPQLLKIRLKTAFRPWYHKIFGIRTVPKSNRI